jgi:hypothetical protein
MDSNWDGCLQSDETRCAVCKYGYIRINQNDTSCVPVADNQVIANCESYVNNTGYVQCNVCKDGFMAINNVTNSTSTCQAITNNANICLDPSKYTPVNGQDTCIGMCNYVGKGYYSTDAIYNAEYVLTGQNQICNQISRPYSKFLVFWIGFMVVITLSIFIARGKSTKPDSGSSAKGGNYGSLDTGDNLAKA